MAVQPAWLLESLEFNNVGPTDHMEVLFAPRLNLFTGDNGLGKSFLLEAAWWALFDSWPGKLPLARHERLPAKILSRFQGDGDSRIYHVGAKLKKRKNKGIDPNIGIFVSANGTVSVCIKGGHFLDTKLLSDKKINEYDDISIYTENREINIKKDEIFDGIRGRSQKNQFLGLIDDVSHWHYKNEKSYKTLGDVLKILSPFGDEIRFGEPKRIDSRDARDIPCIVLPYGETPITHASAGLQRVLSIAYLLVWAAYESQYLTDQRRSVDCIALFIDEIEAHLHPAWQRLILPALMKALEALPVPVKAQIFVTTHSPMVMASTETLCADPDDGLFLFGLDAGKVRLTRQPWEKYGDASAWLQSDLFGLDEARSKPAEELIADIAAVMDFNQLTDEQFRRLDARVAQLLPEQDPMRARWIVWKMKRSGQL